MADTTSNPKDPRIQAYRDSLALYNFSKLQRKLELPSAPDFIPEGYPKLSLNPADYPAPLSEEQHLKNQNILRREAYKAANNSPNIRIGVDRETIEDYEDAHKDGIGS
jgi:hypothetical protein